MLEIHPNSQVIFSFIPHSAFICIVSMMQVIQTLHQNKPLQNVRELTANQIKPKRNNNF